MLSNRNKKGAEKPAFSFLKKMKPVLLAAGAPAAFLLLLLQLTALVPYGELEKFLASPYSITLTDRNGLVLQVLPLAEGVRREYTPLEEIPRAVRDVFIKSEDSRFYLHPGFDPFSLGRALYQNLRYGKRVSGASTITMQLAALISPRQDTYAGKILEIYDAVRLEARLSKKEILELYLNSVPFGFKARGIGTAARTFFGLPLDELSLEQVISLAVIPRRPGSYNPILQPEASFSAASRLARRINKNLTPRELEKLKEEIGKARGNRWDFNAPHFTWYLKNRPGLLGQARLFNYRVRSSLDLDLNRDIEGLINMFLEDHRENRLSNAAVLVLDNRSGEVLAYVGSKDFYDRTDSGQIDGVQVTNQPGSTLKPFLYALALEKGFMPNDILPDIPTDFGTSQVYVPLNYNRRFHGPVRLRVALASSLNVPSVFLATRVGTGEFVHTLTRLGFDSLANRQDTIGSNIALGGEEVSLFELTRAFAVFPRGGKKLSLSFLAVPGEFDPAPPVQVPEKQTGERIFSEYTAYTICNILSDSTSRVMGFGEARGLRTPFPAIFKTGTSNQFNNIWTVGATTDYTVGVWMGNFSGQTVIGKTGSSLPARVAVQILKELSARQNPGSFPLPPGSSRFTICSLSGKKAQSHCPAIGYEYIRKGVQLQSCDYHVIEEGRVTVRYPAVFASWVRDYKDEQTPLLYDREAVYPEFVKPNNRAVFYYDPSISPSDQAVRVEVLHNEQKAVLDIFHNGMYYSSLEYPFIFYFPLKTGLHELEVRGKSGSDSISFEVN